MHIYIYMYIGVDSKILTFSTILTSKLMIGYILLVLIDRKVLGNNIYLTKK